MHKIVKMGIFSLMLACGACQQQSVKFQSVNAEEFSKVIEGKEIQLLDVRTPEEYAEGHLPNSLNIDVKTDNFTELAKQQLNKNKKVALYCRSGRRSKKAAEILEKEGFTVVELSGGYNEWTGSNRKVVK